MREKLMKFGRLTRTVAVILTLLALNACGERSDIGLTKSDLNEIRSIEQRYTRYWLADDTTGIMNLLAEDSVIMPSGIKPIEGKKAIRKFWWPEDGSVTVVTEYETQIEEIFGEGSMALVRGRGYLEFSYGKGAEQNEYKSNNMFLMVVSKNEAGKWKIARRMWGPTDR